MKSKKTTVVLFKKGYLPRIFINPSNIKMLEAEGEILINPKIPKGVSPARWYKDNNQIKVLNKELPDLKSYPINVSQKHKSLNLEYYQKLEEFKQELKSYHFKHLKLLLQDLKIELYKNIEIEKEELIKTCLDLELKSLELDKKINKKFKIQLYINIFALFFGILYILYEHNIFNRI